MLLKNVITKDQKIPTGSSNICVTPFFAINLTKTVIVIPKSKTAAVHLAQQTKLKEYFTA
jgi:hypothetical protein